MVMMDYGAVAEDDEEDYDRVPSMRRNRVCGRAKAESRSTKSLFLSSTFNRSFVVETNVGEVVLCSQVIEMKVSFHILHFTVCGNNDNSSSPL